jgi:hypothetical protein
MGLVFITNLYSIDLPWNDKKLDPEKKNADGTVEKQPDNSLLTIDGVVWFGYEKTDSRRGGTIDKSVDSTGAKSQPTGFTLNRGYLIIKGEQKEGAFKGWDYRVTVEANSGFENAFLKHGYFSAPVPMIKTTWLRFGQQHLPTVDGQAGSSMEGIWGKRYLDLDGKAMWEELGVNGSTDLGISFIHKADFYGAHVMLSNGEGHKKLNGQSISNSSLSPLSQGAGDSHGLDLIGIFSITPLPKDSSFGLHINFPFRFQNVMGMQRREYENITALDYTGNGSYKMMKGNSRAKQDKAYGIEVDGIYKSGSFKATLGVGTVIKIDLQNNSYMIDQKTRDFTKAADVKDYMNNNITPGQDRKGISHYIFSVLSYGKFGLITRYSTGTGTNSVSDKMGTNAGMNINNQMLYQDLKDDGMLNMSPNTAAALIKNGSIEMGKSTFKKITIALEYQVTPKFFISLGFRDIVGTYYNGGAVRNNTFSDLSSAAYPTNSYANNTINKAMGFPSNTMTDNDIIGAKDRDRQIFIRSSLAF